MAAEKETTKTSTRKEPRQSAVSFSFSFFFLFVAFLFFFFFPWLFLPFHRVVKKLIEWQSFNIWDDIFPSALNLLRTVTTRTSGVIDQHTKPNFRQKKKKKTNLID